MDEKDLEQTDFFSEEIKVKPINKRKLFRRTAITMAMAVIFGMVACVTFLFLEPRISNYLNPKEEVVYNPVIFVEDEEEMEPSEMTSDKIPDEEVKIDISSGEVSLEDVMNQIANMQLTLRDYVQLNAELNNYANYLQKSLVTITGVSSQTDWLNDVTQKKNVSTGVIVADNGVELLILADYDYFSENQEIAVSFSNGITVPASLKDRDRETGLGIFAVSLAIIPEDTRESINIAVLGSSASASIYENPVVAVGRSFGRTGLIGYGRILSINSIPDFTDGNYGILQTDIICGNDVCGMLFNTNGRLLGMVTKKMDASDSKNLVNAYGISSIRNLIEQMANAKPRAALGISAKDVTEAAVNEGVPRGICVTGVLMDSPAMKSGIQRGDIIIAFDGDAVARYNDLLTLLKDYNPEDEVTLTVMRKTQDEYDTLVLNVQLKEKK